MKNKIYHISIDYDEPDQSTYRAVVVKTSMPIKIAKKFATGNPEVDFLAAHNWLIKRKDMAMCMYSSSVDHFTMDGDDYEWTVKDGQEFLVRRRK